MRSAPDRTPPIEESEVRETSVRLVGRYCVYGQVATGGTATVHLARLLGPVGFSRIVAIKKPHANLAADPDFAAMFVDEARLAARVRHLNSENVLDVVVSDVELFLVLEYVHGESLACVLRTLAAEESRVPVPIAAAIVAGALQGLHAMHEARDEAGRPLGIVHRDVAPQNVLIGVDGIPRMIDLGVATAAGRVQQTSPGLLKGRLAYMPPERLLGEAPTRRFDVYGAGVVLWESLTGERLFAADTPAAISTRILEGHVPPAGALFEDVPAALDRVVARALCSDPAGRFETARDMAAAIEEATPLASADEVGAWIGKVASEALDARTRLIAAAEMHGSRESGMRWTAAASRSAALQPIEATATRTAGDEGANTATSSPSAVAPMLRGTVVACHPPAEEFPVPISGVRSTLLCAGLAALRSLGHFERYLRHLDDAGRRWAMELVPGAWVPAATAMQHFVACENLDLGTEGAFTVGVESGDRANSSFWKTLEALHHASAPMPWPLLFQYPRLWGRMFEGGAVRVTRLGPTHAEVSVSDVPFARFPYFRDAFRGTNYAALRRCVPGARVFELAGSATATSFAVQAVW